MAVRLKQFRTTAEADDFLVSREDIVFVDLTIKPSGELVLVYDDPDEYENIIIEGFGGQPA